MINWRNKRLPKLEGESAITLVFEMAHIHSLELGFQYFSFMMSPLSPTNQTKPININNYPNEWNRTYEQGHFFHANPIVDHCKRCVLPIVWEENVFRESQPLWTLAKSYGVQHAISQPLHDPQGVFSILTVSRSDGEVIPQELYEQAGRLLWLCHALHALMVREFAPVAQTPPTSKLTQRETEILEWSAKGKTAADIAQILCLSERTVGFHICSCFKKLGVNNKIAAVLSASKAGLF